MASLFQKAMRWATEINDQAISTGSEPETEEADKNSEQDGTSDDDETDQKAFHDLLDPVRDGDTRINQTGQKVLMTKQLWMLKKAWAEK